jgi:chromosome segregation ATPase
MSKQELLDYLNSELTQYDNQIDQEKRMIENIDQAIEQQQQTIKQLEDQKAQCDVNIATYEQDKVYVNELIVIVEKS